MIGILVGTLLNIVLDYVFIFPCGLGMFGAALATGATPSISILILSTHFIKKKNGFSFKRSAVRIRELFHIASLGASSLIGEMSSGVVMLVLNMILLAIAGNIGVAAYGVVANIAIVALSIFNGLAQGVQPLLSDAYGRNDIQSIYKVRKYGWITGLILSGIMYGFIYCFAEPVAELFDRDNNVELVRMAAEGLRLYFVGYVFAAFNIVTAMYFSATDRPLPSFIISILRGIVLVIPCAYLMAFVWGMRGVWLAFAAAEALTMIIATGFVLSKRT
jgi:Na+-driven multidrug efflux pump